jgi:hypothetical protein
MEDSTKIMTNHIEEGNCCLTNEVDQLASKYLS